MAKIFEQLVIDEYEHRKVKAKRDASKDEALTAAPTKKSGKWDKRNVECFNCHKKGHYKSECWAKGGGDKGNGPKWGKGTKEDAAPAEEKTEPEAWAAIEDAQEPTDEPRPNDAAAAAGSIPAWTEQASPHTMTELYDSGASRHMSPFRDCFVSYKEIAPPPGRWAPQGLELVIHRHFPTSQASQYEIAPRSDLWDYWPHLRPDLLRQWWLLIVGEVFIPAIWIIKGYHVVFEG